MLSILLATVFTAAAAPMQLHHQARVLDSSGAPLQGTHTVELSLFNAATGGTTLWTEPQSLTFQGGYVSTAIGSSPANPLLLDDLDGAEVYVAMSIGGTELGPRTRLVAAPYAAVALKALPPVAADDVATRGYVDTAMDNLVILLARTRWREDCYADTLGWPSAFDCIHDGRWHLVATIDRLGTYTQGSQADLIALANQSPDIRIQEDAITWYGYEYQIHAPTGSGIDTSGNALWVRVIPTPVTYSGASANDWQDRRYIFPVTGQVEKGQTHYNCSAATSYANYAWNEGGCGNQLERMSRNNSTTDVTGQTKVYMRF